MWLLALSAGDRWLTLLALISAIFGLMGAVARFAWKIFKAVDSQLEAVRENTTAVKELTGRVDALEGRSRQLDVAVHTPSHPSPYIP
jgi:hypothetical protein